METAVLDINPGVVWVIALSQLLTFGLTVWNLIMSGSRANARAIHEHEEVLQAHGARIASIEQTVVSLPAKDDLHKLRIELTAFHGELREIRVLQTSTADLVRRQEAITTRVEQYLLSRGEGK